jgi:hypothetical protein
MAILSGGGSGGVRWLRYNKMTVGEVVQGGFVSFEADVPGKFGDEDVLTLEDADGVALKGSCPAALSRVFRANSNISPGTGIIIKYKGQGRSKAGKPFHNYEVETVDADASFDPAALSGLSTVMKGEPAAPALNAPVVDELNELEKKLAAARAKKAAQAA